MGPNANDSVMLWANYNGTPDRSVTILEGIKAKLPEGSVIYEKGCDYVDTEVFLSSIGVNIMVKKVLKRLFGIIVICREILQRQAK